MTKLISATTPAVESVFQLAETCRQSGTYWQHCHRALEQYGVTSVCHLTLPFLVEAGLHGLSRASLFRTSHPKQWQESVGGHSLDHDISVELLTKGSQLVFWHEIRSDQSFTDTQAKLDQAELDLGMNVGISVLSRQLSLSGGISGVGLCFGHMQPSEFNRVWAAYSDHILKIVNLLDAGLIDNGLQEIVSLAPREQEMLRYLAAGHRVSDIAANIHKSPKTIEKYIDRAKLKLKATTRDNAVGKALLLGMLNH